MDVAKITTDCPGCKQQQAIIEQQQATIDALVEQVEKLTKRLEKVEREGKRQAAPFRKVSVLSTRVPDAGRWGGLPVGVQRAVPCSLGVLQVLA